MKKTTIVFVGLLLITIGLFGSTYSSPDVNITDNIFDFHISWGPYNFYNHTPGKEPHQMWIDHFVPQLEAVNNANATFVRVSPGFSGSMVADINRPTDHPRFWTYALARFNASLSYLKNNYSIEPLMCTFPIGHYADIIYNPKLGSYQSFGNDSGYYWYWTVMTKLYTSLDDSIPVPWSSIAYRQFTDTSFGIVEIENHDDAVKYWEICNEPANASFLSWGGYFDDTIYNSYGYDTIYSGEHCKFGHFVNYVKVSADVIHSNGGKVIGPATVIPLHTSWDIGVGYRNDSIFRLENKNAFSSPFDFWNKLDSLGALDCFDIISVHGYVGLDDSFPYNRGRIDSFYNQLDSLKSILDSIARKHGKASWEKPIWVTEIGWDRHWWGDYYDYPGRFPNHHDIQKEYDADTAISNRLVHYVEMALNPERKQWLKRTFIYSLQAYPFPDSPIGTSWYSQVFRPVTLGPFGSGNGVYFNNGTDSGYIYDPIPFNPIYALDSIYSIIIPQITLTSPDNDTHTYEPGENCPVQFNGVSDNLSTYTTATSLDSISIKVEYSVDNGITWDTIIDSLTSSAGTPKFGIGSGSDSTGSGSYDWIIPYISSDSCKVRAIATDPYGLQGISTGEGVFSIETSWPYEREQYSLEWNLSYNISGWDHSDNIIENSDLNYLAAVSIQDSISGLFLLNNNGFVIDSSIYSTSFISNITSILEKADGNYIITGKNENDKGIIAIVNSNLNTITNLETCPGIIRDIIHTDGDTFIAVGSFSPFGESKCFIKKYIINSNTIIPCNGNWSIPGELFSIIKDDAVNCYLAVGNRSDSGSCFLKIDQDDCSNVEEYVYPYSGNWAGGIDLIKDVSDNNYIIVGINDHTDNTIEQGAFIRKVDSSGVIQWENTFNEDSFPYFRSFNSVFINNEGEIIVGGTGGNPNLEDYNIVIIAKFDTANGTFDTLFSAPFTVFYTDSIKESLMGRMTQTSDGGYIVGGRIYNTISWVKEIAICKFGYDGISQPFNQCTSGSPFGINAYSVVCASSVFRNQSTIRYMVPRNTHVNVCVYNILGQKVTTLVNGFKDAGVYEVIWNGTDNKGTRVSSGSYFLRFQTEDYIDTKTMTVIR